MNSQAPVIALFSLKSCPLVVSIMLQVAGFLSFKAEEHFVVDMCSMSPFAQSSVDGCFSHFSVLAGVREVGTNMRMQIPF